MPFLDGSGQAPVGAALVARRGKLVGIFTFTDACRLFAEWLRGRFPDPDADDAA